MHISEVIQNKVVEGVKQLFGVDISDEQVTFQRTKKEFEGDFTVVVFPFVRMTKKSPVETAELLGGYLLNNVEEIASYNVIQGFLNLALKPFFWKQFVNTEVENPHFGQGARQKRGDDCGRIFFAQHQQTAPFRTYPQ